MEGILEYNVPVTDRVGGGSVMCQEELVEPVVGKFFFGRIDIHQSCVLWDVFQERDVICAAGVARITQVGCGFGPILPKETNPRPEPSLWQAVVQRVCHFHSDDVALLFRVFPEFEKEKKNAECG